MLYQHRFDADEWVRLVQNEGGRCYSQFAAGSTEWGVILGTPFMRRYFSVFHWNLTDSSGRIGLASASPLPTASQGENDAALDL